MKKIVLIIIVLLVAANSWAVVVTGSGTTKEEAIGNGLREAVEMYTGALVYGVTDVENYQVRKDQIVAASLGHVKKYRMIRTSKIDDLVLVTLDVNLSEDKIERIVRDNVHLITYADVLRDYNNVTQRQDQIRKLMGMMRILANRPVQEKYGVIYEGYEIKLLAAPRKSQKRRSCPAAFWRLDKNIPCRGIFKERRFPLPQIRGCSLAM